jgi:cyclophilin family peptidyl-prolyl cis-trans isomerase
MRNRMLAIVFVVVIVALIAVGVIYSRNPQAVNPSPSASDTLAQPSPIVSVLTSPAVSATPPPETPAGQAPTSVGAVGAVDPALNNASPGPIPSSNPTPDLTVDAGGLSKSIVTLTTTKGVIKFKFYSEDAPLTVKRIIQLAAQGFYNGLSFHRVVPGFVAQGGDPLGNGTGGSGQKLKAEFNQRKHIEGAVAMARSSDPDSADSQFYISLGTHPHLDHSYTVFGQVIEGLDVAKNLKVGDRITSMVVQ